jgi:hypothetical protein
MSDIVEAMRRSFMLVGALASAGSVPAVMAAIDDASLQAPGPPLPVSGHSGR